MVGQPRPTTAASLYAVAVILDDAQPADLGVQLKALLHHVADLGAEGLRQVRIGL